MAHTLPLLLKVHCPPRGPLFILGRPGDEKAPGLEGPGAFFASEILASGALHAQLQAQFQAQLQTQDRKSTRLNSSHLVISYAVFCLKQKHTDLVLEQTLILRPAATGTCRCCNR